jgi:hypothetical protein
MTETDKPIIAACHEMPFTVITAQNLISSTAGVSRSLSGSSLVGSHLNQLNSNDTQSNYWFSRLLEYRGCKLCLGGHKHTYAITYPLREYYYYGDKNSRVDGPMKMLETLENDNAVFVVENPVIMNSKDPTTLGTINLTKFPLITVDKDKPLDTNLLYPYTLVDSFVSNSNVAHTNGVIYFMCQASGFKLFSNKELPSVNQKFSQFLPKSNVKPDGSYSASEAQRSPMFAIIDLTGSEWKLSLSKILNIQLSPSKLFNTLTYGTEAMDVYSLVKAPESGSAEDKLYGVWE